MNRKIIKLTLRQKQLDFLLIALNEYRKCLEDLFSKQSKLDVIYLDKLVRSISRQIHKQYLEAEICPFCYKKTENRKIHRECLVEFETETDLENFKRRR